MARISRKKSFFSIEKNLSVLKRAGSNFSSALRSLKLQIIPQLTRWRNTQEVKKTALYSSRGMAGLHNLPHLIPLVTGIVLVVFNLKTYYIGSMSTNALTAIQFAAKILEIFIQASIAAILLSLVRKQILGGSSFPLGGLVAPFRATDVSYLWSLEMWGSVTTPSVSVWTRIIIIFCVPFAIILAALVGPSSAVLMIPRILNYSRGDVLALFGSADKIYPERVELVDGSISAEAAYNQSLQTLRNLGNSQGQVYITDASVARLLQTASRNGGSSISDNGLSSYTLATIPTQLSVWAISRSDGDFVVGNMQQPYIFLQCHLGYPKIDNNVSDPSTTYVNFGTNRQYLNEAIPYTNLMLNSTDTASNGTTAIWHDFDDQNPESPRCSVILQQPSSNILNHSLLMVLVYAQPFDSSQLVTEACTLDAFWATSLTTYNRGTGIAKQPELLTFNNIESAISSLTDPRLISINPAWSSRILTLADALYPSNLLNKFENFYAQLVLALSYVPYMEDNDTASGYFKLDSWDSGEWRIKIFNDLLSTQDYNELTKYFNDNKLFQKYVTVLCGVNNTDYTNPSQIVSHTYLTGYGYTSDSITVRLSLAVLMTYLVIVIAYLVYSLATGDTSNSWDSVGELVTFAINSRRSDSVRNTSAGVATLETYRQPVNVRVNEHDSLEIVFEAATSQQGHYRRVAKNEQY